VLFIAARVWNTEALPPAVGRAGMAFMRRPVAKPRHLDVRPLLARGEDPLAAIRPAVDALRTGEQLELVAPFLPSPLIERLASEGFASAVRNTSGGAWTVLFWRDAI
jgi:uncharacterized protein (DUF2249 family)